MLYLVGIGLGAVEWQGLARRANGKTKGEKWKAKTESVRCRVRRLAAERWSAARNVQDRGTQCPARALRFEFSLGMPFFPSSASGIVFSTAGK